MSRGIFCMMSILQYMWAKQAGVYQECQETHFLSNMVGLIPTEHQPSRPPCVMLLPKTMLSYTTQSTMWTTKMAAMDYGPSNNRDLFKFTI